MTNIELKEIRVHTIVFFARDGVIKRLMKRPRRHGDQVFFADNGAPVSWPTAKCCCRTEPEAVALARKQLRTMRAEIEVKELALMTHAERYDAATMAQLRAAEDEVR